VPDGSVVLVVFGDVFDVESSVVALSLPSAPRPPALNVQPTRSSVAKRSAPLMTESVRVMVIPKANIADDT
jgi:hypothetical protein